MKSKNPIGESTATRYRFMTTTFPSEGANNVLVVRATAKEAEVGTGSRSTHHRTSKWVWVV